MIRRASPILALATLSVLAVACGAAPEAGEATGSSAAAATAPAPTSCPLAVLQWTQVYVPGQPADPEEGIPKATKGHMETDYFCTALTGASPPEPSGGWGNAVSSCNGLTVVMPPPALATLGGCTPGYELAWTDPSGYTWGTEQVFLCPAGLAAPATDLSANPPIAYVAQQPYDGCLGAPLDPTAWQYMVVEQGNAPVEAPIPQLGLPPVPLGMNCGGSCGCL